MIEMKKTKFIIENITYDHELHKISGNCIEGPYLGEVEIYLPPFVSDDNLQDSITIAAYCGPGMTMSLPPQLMGCIKIEVVEDMFEEYVEKVEIME